MPHTWQCGRFQLDWGRRALLMGVLNATPDSFSDGGDFADPHAAIDRAYRLFEEGADLVDVGGESSRPGAEPIPFDEELRRVLPIVEEIAGRGNLPVSIDTVKYETASRCIDAGACAINDISGLQRDPRLATLAAQSGAGLALMHMRGDPQTMQSMTDYEDLIGEVRAFFECQISLAQEAQAHPRQIVLDPGIGFGKTAQQNLTLIHHLERLRVENYPILVGVSRKSFIGAITGKAVHERKWGTAAAVAVSVWQGANLLRIHDVSAMRDAAAVAEAILREKLPERMETES